MEQSEKNNFPLRVRIRDPVRYKTNLINLILKIKNNDHEK